MKKLLLLTLLAMLLQPGVWGQESVTVFLDSNYEKADSAAAAIKRTIVYQDGRYVLTDQTLEGEMLHYGTYLSFDPWIEHGLTKHYDGPGVLYSYGHYEQGRLAGKWVYLHEHRKDTIDYDFYRSLVPAQDCAARLEAMQENKRDNDQRIKVVNALRSFADQRFILPARTLDRSKGFVAHIDFIMDPSGEITCPVISGTDDEDLILELRRLIHRFRYGGTISRPFKVRFNLIHDPPPPPLDLKEVIFTVVEDSPSFQGDLEKYILGQRVYPEEALKRGAYGGIFVNFVVEPDGTVSNVNTPRMVDPSLNQEAIRLIESSSGRWNPGRQRGEAVRVRVNVIVPFDRRDMKKLRKKLAD